MNNLLSFCGLVVARISASEKRFTCTKEHSLYYFCISQTFIYKRPPIQKLCFIPERKFSDACLFPNNACLSKYFSSLGRPCSRIFGQAHSYIGYSNRNFFLIPKIKQEQLLKTWVSHIYFWSLIIGALGFLRHPDMMSLIHV